MNAAAEAQDFEAAARLRDEIEALRGQTVRKPPPGAMGLGTNIPVAAPPKGWRRPTLNDYVGFQMNDGQRVQSYRFALPEAEASAIAARLPAADAAAPLFCASAVNNALAGIGPFAGIKPVNWMTPAAVAEQLEAILAANPGIGRCVLPDGSSCAQPVQVRAAAVP